MLGSNRIYKKSLSFPSFSKRFVSDKFQAGDYAIITPLKKTVTKKQWLSRPLKDLPNATVNINFGKIPHQDLINSTPYGQVHTMETKKKLAKYTVSKPTLEEWITMSNRKAQPIYSFDAQAIVALSDLHIDYPEAPNNEDGGKITPLQFLEAGTGHGSLTLAISKALHAANALAHYAEDPSLRGAILHSVDCNSSHSIQGRRTLKGFRRGMYSNNVEFHISDSPSDWILSDDGQNWLETELVSKKQETGIYDPDEPNAFLSGVYLDMPNYHEELVKLAPFVKAGGFMIVFCPSITQIIDAIDLIAEKNEFLSKQDPPSSLHLEHERTVQLLDGAGGGLKEWDTRRTFIRATGKIGYSVRPKVGVRTVAGGFVAIWRKMGREVNLELERDLMENYEGKPDPTLNGIVEEEVSSEEVVENVSPTENKPTELKTTENTVNKEDETDIKTKSEFEGEFENSSEIQNASIQPIERGSSSSSTEAKQSSRLAKAAMYAPDLMSTAPEVFEDVENKEMNGLSEFPVEDGYPVEEVADSEEPVDLENDENPDFKVEEATLIPFSVLNTVFHSCHGDPDVHVGYIKDVLLIPSPAPEGMEVDTPDDASSTPVAETVETQPTESNSPAETVEDNGMKEDEIEPSSSGKPKKWVKHTF